MSMKKPDKASKHSEYIYCELLNSLSAEDIFTQNPIPKTLRL